MKKSSFKNMLNAIKDFYKKAEELADVSSCGIELYSIDEISALVNTVEYVLSEVLELDEEEDGFDSIIDAIAIDGDGPYEFELDLDGEPFVIDSVDDYCNYLVAKGKLEDCCKKCHKEHKCEKESDEPQSNKELFEDIKKTIEELFNTVDNIK